MAIEFCGAKVVNFTATAQWDGAESYVSVNVIDTEDYPYVEPAVGSPMRFQASSFIFDGIIQRHSDVKSAGGFQKQIQLVSPSELLAGAVVVLEGDSTYAAIPNLVNVFGYYESNAFGSAQTNDTGMLWNVFASGVNAVLSGNPLQLKGHTYEVKVDTITSGVNPPANYRIRGEVTNFTDIFNQVCQDAGFNYLVKLNMGSGTHHEIDFILVDRTIQPSLDYINTFASGTKWIEKEVGREFRNDYTNAFLVGGDVHELRLIENTAGLGNKIWPFWGADVNGNIIIGTGTDDDHTVNLNATPIAAVMGFLGGGSSYTCTVREMRCALESYDSWANFLNIWRPTIASALKIRCTFTTDGLPPVGLPSEWMQDSQTQLEDWSDQVENSDFMGMGMALYEFVRGYASEFYGKKFLVRIPDFINYYLQPDTVSSYKFSHELAQSAFLPDGSLPLGLDYYNELFFQDQEGKTTCFVRVDADPTIDLNSVPPEGSVVQTGLVNALYLQARPIDNIVMATFPDTSLLEPCAIIDLGAQVMQTVPDPYGGLSGIATVLAGPGAGAGDITNAYQLLLDGLDYSQQPPLRLAPPVFKPDAAAIPIKSNHYKYGPWFFSGAPGKTYYEQDDSLTPWEHGDWTALEAAAQARLQNIISNNQEVEVGTIKHVGLPMFGLGDLMGSGGPNISQITLDVSQGGFTTAYQIETYSHRLYKFYNERANQIKRTGLALQQIRRGQRIQFFAQRERYFAQMQHKFGNMHRISQLFRQQSPHHVMVAHAIPDSSRYTHASVSIQKYSDSIINGRIKKTQIFKNTAIVGMESLFAPYATYSGSNMPYARTTGLASSINASSLNPWISGNNVEWVTRGTGEYQRLCPLHATSVGWNNVRAVGLKGPLNIVGWGRDLYNSRPWPNSGGRPGTGMLLQNMSNNFAPNFARNLSGMISAPVDFRFDPFRNVWASPGAVLVGTTSGTVPSGGGSGFMTLLGQANNTVTIYNHFNVTVSGNKKVICGYYPINDRWYITAAEC